MFSYEYCQTFKNTYFEEHLQTANFKLTEKVHEAYDFYFFTSRELKIIQKQMDEVYTKPLFKMVCKNSPSETVRK